MALITVADRLVTPTGQVAPNIPIKIIALKSTKVLPDLPADLSSDSEGLYSFGLDEGIYSIEVLVTDQYHLSGIVTVDQNTPTELTIVELLNYSPPVPVPTVNTPVGSWEDLVTDHETQPDLVEQEHRDQVVDGSAHSAEVLEVSSSEQNRTRYAKTSNTTGAGTAASTKTSTIIHDDVTGNEAVWEGEETKTENITHTSKKELFEDTEAKAVASQIVQTSDLVIQENQSLETSGTSTALSKDESIGSSHGRVTLDKQLQFDESDGTGSAGQEQEVFLESGTDAGRTRHTETVDQTYRDDSSIEVNAPRSMIEDVVNASTDLNSVEVRDTRTALEDKDGVALGQAIREVIANGKRAVDGLFSDGIRAFKKYWVDTFTVADKDGTSVLEVDTVNKEVKLNARLTVANPDDFKGDPGDTIFEVYQYSTDAVSWHTDYVAGDLYRRFNTSVNGYVDPLKWSDAIKMFAEDGLQGDTLYIQYNYSTDLSNWHEEFADGDIWRRERTITNGSPSTDWTDPARIVGADGVAGDTVVIEYEYSVDGLEPWHSNFSTGDHYRRERLVTNGVPAPWSSASKLVPVKDVDYFDGLSQVVVHLYIRSTAAPDLPTTTLTYNFADFSLSGDTAGWSTAIPEGTGNLWLTVATASSNTGSDDIAPNEWTDPQISATQAYNQASLSLYKRSAVGVVPEAPSTTLVYDFSTGALTGDLEGWSNGTIPAGTQDLYIASATVRSQTNTGNVEPEHWGVGILTSTAFRQQTVNIYRRGDDTRPANDVTYNFTDGSVTGLSDWSLDIPEGTEDIYIGVAVASAAGVVDTIHPADWSISPLGASGHQAVVLNLYQSGSTKPQEPQVEITYDFTQGKITSSTGAWSQSVPANTLGKIYVTTATANASALETTDVIPVGEWTDPQVILESGINAVPVTLYCKHDLDSAPPKHTNDLTYSFSTASIITAPNNDWQTYPMSVSLGEGVWSITATANGLAGAPTDVIEPSEFSDPVIYTATGSEVYTVYKYSETKDGTYYDEFTPERVWRIQGTYINGTVSDWSDPVKLTGEDGAVGDTIYVEYNYSPDLSVWHSTLEDGDIWRRERIVTNGVADGWTSPARIKGDAEIIEYQYSASLDLGEVGWHSNFSSGDHYRRERAVFNGVAGPWTEGVQIVPLKDVDYSDGESGDTIFEIYEYSEDGVTNWHADFTDADIYRRTATVINGAASEWSVPAKLSGIDGAPGDTIYMEYEYSADGVNWHKDMEDGDIWRHEREHTAGVTVPSDPWGNRTRIRGIDGAYHEYLYNDDDDFYPTTPEDDYGTWHANFSEGDYYRIERLVTEDSVGNWTAPAKLKPIKGEDYDEIYYEYSYSPDKITWDMTVDSNDIWRRERRVENGIYGEWSEPIKMVGTDGTSLLVQLVSDNGFFFKNNTGAVKTISAELYINSEKLTDLSGYLFHWTVGNDTVYVTAAGEYVSLTPSSGLYPANGGDENGLNFPQIQVDFSDVAQGSSLNLLCEVTEIQGTQNV